ncbi:NUDIX hydrolase [Tranquillimonas alkanivorans]|uniref:8-oxo-dGTP diphosphatase n=1 Tax=Tranquillimonas alkanivorans TaxID=441119 RepID=A0A1I5PSS5_9RHOB|nr:NUDIX hydrolase [Tranquillimonas alkanivorans]SFP37168.1 8-oxo-dGTP diphosphatase [Tranquillimonas alkanivorans]
MTETFDGAKLAILCGSSVVTLLRDDIPGIVYPGHWDLPGGGREGGEAPLACALRETEEEVGLRVPESAVVWGRAFDRPEGLRQWLFVAEMPDLAVSELRLGDEGQRWELMPLDRFLGMPNAVPHLKARLAVYLDEVGRAQAPRSSF